MKSPSAELFAQVMFFSGMACLPLSLVLACLGAVSKRLGTAILWFLAGSILFTHFLFYFAVLGGSLGTKVGRYEMPSWFSFLPYSLVGVAALIVLWLFLDRRRVKSSPPPLPENI